MSLRALAHVPLQKLRDSYAGEPNRRTAGRRLRNQDLAAAASHAHSVVFARPNSSQSQVTRAQDARRRAIHACASVLSAEPPRKQPQHNKHNCTKITGCPVLEARRRRRRAPTARRATARRRRRPEARRRSATRATEFQTAPRRRASGRQPEARGGRARARRRRAARLQIGSSPTGRAWILMKRTTLYLL